MQLPTILLLCLVLGTAAPAALGRRALAHTGKHADTIAAPGPAPADPAVASPAPAPADTVSGSEAANRIIDGAADATNWASFTAYIRFTDVTCTGSLVGPAHILTAAHCLYKADGSMRTCVDVEYVEIDGQQYGCGTLLAHSGFQHLAGPRDQPANDVALIGLTAAPAVTFIPLATSAPAPGAVVYAIGFGATEAGPDAPVATTRMYTDMVVYDPAACTVPSGPYPDDFCAGMGSISTGQGVLSNGGHACHGDSGGPVVDTSGQLTGVVSWGQQDCTVPYSYFTSVADHLELINDMIDAWPIRA